MPTTNQAAAGLRLEIARVFDAPRDLVFACWTQEKHMAHWRAPRDFLIVDSSADIRPGGKWRVVMRFGDGVDHEAAGEYLEVTPTTRLVLTHGWLKNGQPGHRTTITITFADDDQKTRMHFVQETFQTKAARDGHAGGWGESLDRLAEYLGTL